MEILKHKFLKFSPSISDQPKIHRDGKRKGLVSIIDMGWLILGQSLNGPSTNPLCLQGSAQPSLNKLAIRKAGSFETVSTRILEDVFISQSWRRADASVRYTLIDSKVGFIVTLSLWE